MLLAGCQKPGGVGSEIRFRAVTVPEPQTKTVYSGVATGTPKMERINWSENDVIRIYSDVASCNNDNTYHWADYQLSVIDNSTEPYSKAGTITVTHPTRGGLAWDADGTYNFYSIFPAPADDPAATVRGTSGTPFACTIPAAQVGSATTVAAIASLANTTVYYPSMANAYLVAHDSKTKGNDITLDFSPAYTAFHISAGAGAAPETAKVIKSVTLTSTSTALNGAYTAYYDSGWNYNISGTGMTATFTFSDGNYTIPVGEKVEFVIFAMPQVLTDLTLTFTLADDSTRSLKLKKNTPDATTNAAGFINFAPCKKHYISGLVIPGSIWTVDEYTTIKMSETVSPWDTDDENISYGTDPIISASKIEGSNPYTFSLFAPLSDATTTYYWKVTAYNDAAHSSVATNVTLTQAANSSTDGVLKGAQPTTDPSPITFDVTGPSGTYYLSFSVQIGTDGREISINSEVARNTDGYRITL